MYHALDEMLSSLFLSYSIPYAINHAMVQPHQIAAKKNDAQNKNKIGPLSKCRIIGYLLEASGVNPTSKSSSYV